MVALDAINLSINASSCSLEAAELRAPLPGARLGALPKSDPHNPPHARPNSVLHSQQNTRLFGFFLQFIFVIFVFLCPELSIFSPLACHDVFEFVCVLL